MSKEVLRLKCDLLERLKHLNSLREFKNTARIRVGEYFQDLIRQVEMEADQFMRVMGKDKRQKAKREAMIAHLQKQQDLMIDAIPQISQNEANISQLSEMANKCESLAFEIETLFLIDATDSKPASPSSEPSERDLTPYLEAYERIYLEMFEMANKLDKMLLWGKCFFFMSYNSYAGFVQHHACDSCGYGSNESDESGESKELRRFPYEMETSKFGILTDLDYYISAHEIKYLK